MKMYMSHAGDPSEGASLVFAHNAREAKKIAWKFCPNCDGCDFLDVRVNLIKESEFPWLMKEANQKRLEADEAHLNDSPNSCKRCETWGLTEVGENGLCEDCDYEREEEEAESAQTHQLTGGKP